MKLPDMTKLTRNPLGVIGLFIWLIYSIAGLVFSTTVASLSYSIQLILTLFVVVFPAAILAVFYVLVTRHHKKLYAPGDFRDETLFFRPATEVELQVKEKELEDPKADAEAQDSQTQSAQEPSSGKSVRHFELENAALDYVERRFGRRIQRDFVAEVDGRSFFVDGVYEDSKRLDLFEVKNYRRPVFKREFIEAVLYRASSILLHQAVNEKERDFKVWLVIVSEFDGPALDEFSKRMKAAVDTNNFEVEWVFVPRSELGAGGA